MPKYFLETSAFVKRYKEEAGSRIINSLFNSKQELFYLNLAIIEIRKVFYRLRKYPLRQDNSITEEEFNVLNSRFAVDITQMKRVEFTEEMVDEAVFILERTWIPNIFDLAQLSAYLITKKEYPDIVFVCSDERSKLIDGARQFVREEDIVIPYM